MKTLKMMVKEKNASLWKILTITIALVALILTSCNEDKVGIDTTLDDQESVQLDNDDDFILEDADEIASDLLEKETTSSGGKVSEGVDERLTCAVVTKTGTKSIKITILN